MRRHWAVLQTRRNMEPAETVLVQNEWCVAGDRVEAGLVTLRPKGRFSLHRKVRSIEPGPLELIDIPPNEFLLFAPRPSVRSRARSIIYDAAISGPGEAPTVSEIVLRVAGVRLVDFVPPENARVNPAATGSRAVSFQLRITVNLRPVMRVTLSILSKHHAVTPSSRVRVPAIDLRQDRFHPRLS